MSKKSGYSLVYLSRFYGNSSITNCFFVPLPVTTTLRPVVTTVRPQTTLRPPTGTNVLIPGAMLLSVFPNTTSAQVQFYVDLIKLNLDYYVKMGAVSELVRNSIMNALPKIIVANTQKELLDAVEPLIMGAFVVYFEDPFIIFTENPYKEAATRFLKQFFASPQAPDFLDDPKIQAQILSVVDEVFSSKNLTVTFNNFLKQM